jgi:hypothetical protein
MFFVGPFRICRRRVEPGVRSIDNTKAETALSMIILRLVPKILRLKSIVKEPKLRQCVCSSVDVRV